MQRIMSFMDAFEPIFQGLRIVTELLDRAKRSMA